MKLFQFMSCSQFALITNSILQSACEFILTCIKELYFCAHMEACNKEERGNLEAFGCFCILSKIS